MEIDMTTACDEKGRLVAMKARITSDTGAYASLGGPVLQRACTHAAGPYNYQDVDIIGEAWYTNNPPAGAFRGFGVTQSCFAVEQNMNLLAEEAGMDPWEFRYLNAIHPGQTLPNGQIADESTALVETLEAVKPYYDAHPGCGIACALKNSGLGVGIPDAGRCRLVVKNGKVHIYSSAACIGQGMGTVQMQIVCETTALHPSFLSYEPPNTALAPDAGNTTASRQTLFTGEAAARAAGKLYAEMLSAGYEPAETGRPYDSNAAEVLAALDGKEYMGEYLGVTDRMGSKKPNPMSHIAYGYATHLAELDADGKVKKIIAAHDSGCIVNPSSIEGQIQGGVVMSMGYALTEDFPLKDCVPTARFGTLGLLRSTQIPEIEVCLCGKGEGGKAVFVGCKPALAYGAKGVGEISAIPTAPALAHAYMRRDGKFRPKLPLEDTPYSRKKK
jgi:CO/xanthine dehydrogenase Mo-binding subunit